MTSPICISSMGTRPPSGVNESCIALTEPFDAAVVAVAHNAELTHAEAGLLAFHVPAGLQWGRHLIDVELREPGIAGLFRADANSEQCREHEGHDGQQRPALAGVTDHAAKGVAQRSRNKQDRQQFEEIGKRRGILDRMRRIGVEESAPVGAELLDRNLRSGGTDCDRLLVPYDLFGSGVALFVLDLLAVDIELWCIVLGRLDQRHGLIDREGLHHALGYEHQSENERERQEYVKCAARQVDPEVADSASALPGEAADQRDQHGHARCRGNKVLHGKGQHLCQVTHGRFARIALPVGVADKADGGIERRVRRHRRQILRIQRQEICSRCNAYTARKPSALKTSTATAYCVQRMSCAGSTPQSR